MIQKTCPNLGGGQSAMERPDGPVLASRFGGVSFRWRTAPRGSRNQPGNSFLAVIRLG
jgi:hypothetical protein